MDVEIEADGHIKLKIILVGEAGVGKTNLINIMRDKAFGEEEDPTSNCGFFEKEIEVDNKIFNVYLWDTIGQEKLRAQTTIFFKNSKIVVLVYDITNRDSFDKLEEWYKLAIENLGKNIILGVLGNKSDLYLKEKVKDEEGEEYAKSIDAKWSLSSAKSERKQFIEYINELIRIYIKKASKEDEKNKSFKVQTAKLKKEKDNKGNKCCK